MELFCTVKALKVMMGWCCAGSSSGSEDSLSAAFCKVGPEFVKHDNSQQEFLLLG